MSLEIELQALLAAAVTPVAVVLADQSTPRPTLPYWTMRVSVLRKKGDDAQSQGVTTQGDMQRDGVREATVQLQRYGAGSVDAAEDLRMTLSKISVGEAWAVKKLAIYDMTDVKNVPFKLDNNTFEPRAAFDLFVRFGVRYLDRVGEIASVAMSGNYETTDTTEGFDANVDLAQTITVVL